MNKKLRDLEKLTNFTSGESDTRKSLLICKNCNLLSSSYSLVFYKNIEQESIPIMFISRDPNIKPKEIKKKENPKRVVTSWEHPKKRGLGWFILDFLVENGLWEEFLRYVKNLENANNMPRFYWTHMVKCYASNNKSNVKKAEKKCKEYLKKEINKLNPKLIIGCGIDVANALFPKENNESDLIKHFSNLTESNKSAYKARKGIVIIPHPSCSWYQRWKKGCFSKVGISYQELECLINKVTEMKKGSLVLTKEKRVLPSH